MESVMDLLYEAKPRFVADEGRILAEPGGPACMGAPPGVPVSVSIGLSEHPKSGKGWQATGVIPDVAVPAEKALATAIHRSDAATK
jgi:hypothetical protein